MLNNVPWPVSKSDEIELCNLTEYLFLKKSKTLLLKKHIGIKYKSWIPNIRNLFTDVTLRYVFETFLSLLCAL